MVIGSGVFGSGLFGFGVFGVGVFCFEASDFRETKEVYNEKKGYRVLAGFFFV